MTEQDQDSRTKNLDGAIEELEKEILVPVKAQDDLEDTIIPWVIEFRVVGTPDILRAPVGETLVFGRHDAGRNIHPEIDLSNYDAQDLGVSRRHARLIARDNRVTVEDMGSANGTYINGNQIPVMHPYRIHEGDILQLGNLKLQVHFVVKPSTDEETLHGLGNEVIIPKLGQGRRMMILDDNNDVCNILRFIATRAGFQTVVVHSLADAISAIDEQMIDCLILEVMLSDGNGLDVVTYLRGLPDGKQVPVIALGGDTSGFREGEALQAGAQIYLPKPLAIDKLIAGLTDIGNPQAK